MKHIKYFIYTALFGLVFVSCKDVDLPFQTFEELEKGAFSRLLSTDNGAFFFTDPDNSAFSFTMEYYGENDGGDIASHDWYVRHRNNQDGTSSDNVLLTSLPAASFGTDAKSGLPTGAFSFSLNDALAAMGKTIDDVNGGDDIIFDGIIVMNDGREFGPDNTESNLQGSNGFDGRFRFVKSLLCSSDLDGTYDAVTTVTNQGAGIGWDGCDGLTWTGQIRFEQFDPENNPGEYKLFSISSDGTEFEDMSMGAYIACYGSTSQGSFPNGDVVMKDACNQLSYSGASQWGEVFSFNEVTVDGNELTIGWENDYGEGGSTVLTNPNGWPNLKG